jgi:site-specific DNA recombinase
LSKVRTASDGSRYGGQPLARGALYLLLQNRIYRGEIVHKGKSYPGEHEAIVDGPQPTVRLAMITAKRLQSTCEASILGILFISR